MKVVTLHPDTFGEVCQRLADKVAEWHPDILVGIVTGGEIVARNMAKSISQTTLHTVKLQRSTTARKSSVRKLLKLLPTSLADRLRIMEARKAERRPHKVHEPLISSQLEHALKENPKGKVLIVDDAVDSGDTLLSVVKAIQRIVPDAEVKSAVLTVTTSKPAISPDYSIWNDKTLLRFPWSLDYRTDRP